jgi:cobalt-zinc-cadmium efflux system membrane fusion protein
LTKPTLPTACLLTLLPLSLCGGGCGSNSVAEERKPEAHKDFLKLEPGSPRLDFIKIEAVRESAAASVVTLTGKVGFDEDHTQRVATPIDGRVTGLLVKVGDKVRAGQPLLELSSPQVGQLQADALKAQHDYSIAEKSLERANRLKGDGAISDKEAAQADADFKKAKADVARTAAQLRALGISATDPAVRVSLRAQIPGTVVDRQALQGMEVRADQAQPLLTVTSLDSVWVAADLYEQDLALVQAGQGVAVRVPAYPGESFAGKIGLIGEVVDPTTRTVKVRCIIPNPDHKLKPEMFAKVDLQDKTGRSVLQIPTKAVLSDGEKTKVVVATEGNVFRVRAVDLGPEVDGLVRVIGGIRPGERIVTDGALFLKHEIEDL